MNKNHAAPKALIVDDDSVAATICAAVLEDLGFQVEIRTSPFGTGAYIQQKQPDIVLLDVQMPGLSGDQIAQMIRITPGNRLVHVILYSARPMDELVALGQKTGAIGVIRKSGDPMAFARDFTRITQTLRYLAK
jgi:CheY-like chemotaxis protein